MPPPATPSRLSPGRRRRKAHARILAFLRHAVLARDDYTCGYCRRRMALRECTVDHRLPISRGGTTVKRNLITACDACNGAKKNMTEEEFRDSPAYTALRKRQENRRLADLREDKSWADD